MFEIPLKKGIYNLPLNKVQKGRYVLKDIKHYNDLLEALKSWIKENLKTTQEKYEKNLEKIYYNNIEDISVLHEKHQNLNQSSRNELHNQQKYSTFSTEENLMKPKKNPYYREIKNRSPEPEIIEANLGDLINMFNQQGHIDPAQFNRSPVTNSCKNKRTQNQKRKK